METLDEQDVTAITASEALLTDQGRQADVTPATEETAPENSGTQEEPSFEQLLAEAEQRGYLRGRNEAVALEMQRPAQWENTRQSSAETGQQPLILNNMRRSVWE